MNNETGKPKKAVNKKALKIGSISITTTAVVIAIFIVVNLFVGELPSTATKFDLSARELFTISDETRAVLSRVDEDVKIYLLTQRGQEDPTNRDMLGGVYAAEALLGIDEYCIEYLSAYRDDLFGVQK